MSIGQQGLAVTLLLSVRAPVYKPVHVIEVRVREHTVGAVALDPLLGYYAFEYVPTFIRTGIRRNSCT